MIDASVKFIKVGITSPSSPAASSWAASHRDRTVPTSCAKHSVHARSELGLPPTTEISINCLPVRGFVCFLTSVKIVQFQKVAFLIKFI